MSLVEILVALAITVGIIGIVVPLLPGSLLVGAAVALWAADTGGQTAWLVAGAVLVVLLLGTVLKYAVPGRRLTEAGVPARTLWLGAALGFVGFFVVPVVGLLPGFVLGIYLAERARLGKAAWPSTVAALRAVGLSILIELVAAAVAASLWLAGVAAT